MHDLCVWCVENLKRLLWYYIDDQNNIIRPVLSC